MESKAESEKEKESNSLDDVAESSSEVAIEVSNDTDNASESKVNQSVINNENTIDDKKLQDTDVQDGQSDKTDANSKTVPSDVSTDSVGDVGASTLLASMEDSSSSSGVVRFKRLKLSHRNYRDKSSENLFATGGGEDGENTSSDNNDTTEQQPQESDNSSSSSESEDDDVINLQDQLRSSSSSSSSTIGFDVDNNAGTEDRVGGRRTLNLGLMTSESEEDDEDRPGNMQDRSVQEDGQMDEQAEQETKSILDKPQPTPKFNVTNYIEIHRHATAKRRKLQNSFYSSLSVVKRMNVNYKLSGHEGCVNSLHFNHDGTKLASGSDDLMVNVWDWQNKTKLTTFPTGHRENVFQSKFLPGDLLITSCSRDGQVRLAELCPAGSLRSTRKLAQHRGAVHKLSLAEDNYIVLSAGEDAQVLTVDTREQKAEKLLLLKSDADKKIPIYSIHTNPVNHNQFCTAGRENWVRVFDRRYVSGSDPREVVKYCPSNLRSGDTVRSYITCAVFSYDGSEVVASYSDEDIYLFETRLPEQAEHSKQFRGHRNSNTVKGVNMFGAHSEYVISGSDCGNVFFWSKETESIVNISKGDDNGVVNVLEPHPTMPILATSGLDEEVKIWYPNKPIVDDVDASEKELQLMKKTIKKNMMNRMDTSDDADSIYGHLLYQLWHNLRRVEQRRLEGQEGGARQASEPDQQESSDEDDEGPRRPQCAQS